MEEVSLALNFFKIYSWSFLPCRAVIFDGTETAQGFPGLACVAPMLDEDIAEVDPVLFWYYLHQIEFNFFRIYVHRKAQAGGYSLYMGIYDNPDGFSEVVSKNDVGCFSADTWKLN